MQQNKSSKHLNALPIQILTAVRNLGWSDQDIVTYAISDLNTQGNFSEMYAIASTERLLIMDASTVLSQYELKHISKFHILELFASSTLVADIDAVEEKLIQYSKAKSAEFADFFRRLNEMLRNTNDTLRIKKVVTSCSRCGYPLPEADASCPRCVPSWYVLKRLLTLLQPYQSRVLLVVFCTFIAVAAQMAPPYLTKRIVDDVILVSDASLLPMLIGLMLAAGFIYLIARWVIVYVSSWLSARLITDLRSRLHIHLQQLQMRYFNQRSSGDIVARVMQDTTELQQFMIEGLPFLLVNGLSFIAIAIILISMDPVLAAIAFLPVPFLIYGVHWIWNKLRPLLFKRARYRGEITSILSESIQGVRAVKAAGCEQQRETRFNHYNEQFFESLRRVMSTFAGFAEGSYWLMSVGVATIWFVASIRLTGIHDNLTLGELLAFVAYIWLFYAPLQWFGVVMNWMNNAFAGAERIFNILDTEPENYQPQNAIRNPVIKGNIVFDEVHFSYEKGKEVLKGIDVQIHQGEMIGLVGKSGMGKSTLINLICRFYEVDSGQILLDGQPLDDYALQDLRQSIGIVMQDPFIFYGSIRDNIAYGKPDATLDAIISAARAASAHEFVVEKEFGYDTVIGENGIQLSGGERQRIAIARAILQDPAILILDEATSLVDSETEQVIQNAIDQLVKNRTTIAIAHRLGTLRNATRLLVIDEGKIVEQGSHAELLKQDGLYANLLKVQSKLNKLQTQAHIA